MKRRIALIVFEAALVVMGVLLGLFANQWRAERADQLEAEAALRAIRAELQSNYDEVEGLLAYRRQMEASLDSLVRRVVEEDGVVVSAEELRRALPRGFSVPIISTSAWTLAQQTGVVNHIDFELAATLSNVYALQAFYQDKLEQISANWYVAGNLDPENFAATALAVGALANDILVQEERLVERYPPVIERLASPGP